MSPPAAGAAPGMPAEESAAKTDPGSKQLKIARKLKVRIASPTTRAVNVS